MSEEPTPVRTYAMASGRDPEDLAFIAYKYDDEETFRDTVHSYLGYLDGNDFGLSASWDTWVSGLWRSDSGRVYVCTPQGGLFVLESARSARELVSDKVTTAFNGIFGLDDEHVWACGGSPAHGGMIHVFDGQGFSRMADPPGWVIQLHGCAPDCLYGVGQREIYHWDGQAWSTVSVRGQALAGIHVVSPDEIYATSREGVLYGGSADGWIERARWDGPLVGVGKCHDVVWLGGEEAGLLRLDGSTNQIEQFKPNVMVRHFDCRGRLVVPTEQFIGYSLAADRLKATGIDGLKDLL